MNTSSAIRNDDIRTFQTFRPSEDELRFLEIRRQEERERELQEREERLILNQRVSSLICSTGISTAVKGFKYIKAALEMALIDNVDTDLITKEVYPKVAKMYKTKSGSVERAMRTAIMNMEKNIDSRSGSTVLQDMFSSHCGHCTNKEFISYLVEYMRVTYGY